MNFFYAAGIVVTLLLAARATTNGQAPKELPKVITPVVKGKAPSDAIILFNKGSLNAFESVNGGPANWNVKGKTFTVNPGAGNILTKQSFRDFQLHIEWRTPNEDVKKGLEGQKNGNSGIYIMGRYELQVLNSYENETDPDRQAGSIYKHHTPMVNSMLPPGKWQTYDIIFTAPQLDSNGELVKPGLITVLHNGVLIQYNAEITAPTVAYLEGLDASKKKLPIMLQDHTNKVSYRNIWIREL